MTHGPVPVHDPGVGGRCFRQVNDFWINNPVQNELNQSSEQRVGGWFQGGQN